jgi:polysaccharide pyruvyl transferase CsaB
MSNPSTISSSPTPSIMIIGFYGSGNFGDDMMCVALARLLTENTNAKITILARDPEVHASLKSHKLDVRRWSAAEIWRSVHQSDILCQGGGTNFHDSYAGRKLIRHWCNLTLWAAIFWIARLRRKRVLLLGAGIGPLRRPLTKCLSRIAFSACASIGVRDQASARTLSGTHYSGPCEIGFDLAAVRVPTMTQRARSRGERLVLAISACSLSEFLGSADLNASYWSNLGQAISIFNEQQPIRVKFCSLYTGASSDSDELAAEIIRNQLPKDLALEHAKYDGSIERFALEFSAADLFLCTKYHAAVMAYLWSCNFAVITYNRKVADFADEIGLPGRRRVDASRPQPVDVWLQVLHELASGDISQELLSREEASNRATQAVLKILADSGITLVRAPKVAA